MAKRPSLYTIIPSLLTLVSCCAGLTAFRYALDGDIERGLFFILAAGVLDALDGTMARWLKATSQFGGELDSLADFVAFGVSPGLIIYYAVTIHVTAAWGWIAVLIFIMCCGLRLARFNVANFTPSDNHNPQLYFCGVPAPAGGILALMPLAFMQVVPDIQHYPHTPLIYAVWLGLIGVLMVSNLPTFSPKKIRISRRYRIWVILLIVSVSIIAIERPWIMWVSLSCLYLVSIPLSFWLSNFHKQTDIRD